MKSFCFCEYEASTKVYPLAPRTATNISAFTISPVFLFTIGTVTPL